MKDASALRTSFVLLSCGRTVTLATTLLTVAVMARHLGVAGYGDYRVIIAFLTMAMGFANLGTNLIVQRELAKHEIDRGRVFGNALGLRLMAITIAVAVAGLIALVSLRPIVAAGIAVGSIGFIAVGTHNILFAVFQQFLRQAGAVIAETAGAVVLLALAWLLGRAEFGVLAFVIATSVGSVLTATISTIGALRLLSFRPRFELVEWKRIIVPALPIAATAPLTLIYYRFDTILLSLMQPAEAVGLYGVPSKILDALMGFTLLFSGLLMPLMSRYIEPDFEKFRLYFDTGIDTLIIGMSGILVVFLIYAEDLLTLIAGTPFAAGAPALRVLGVVLILASTRFMALQAVTVLNVQSEIVTSYIVASVVGLMSYVTLIYLFSATGAALGLLVGESIVLISMLRVLRRHGIRVPLGVPLKVLLSVIVTTGTMAWVKSAAGLPWVLGALLALAVYFLLLLLIRGIPSHVLELLQLARAPGGDSDLVDNRPGAKLE